ncbi:MAG: DUF2189 domain-containing protein [Rhodobacteraceae bacterium]|nr:DUF2189 domain-containing protein [Paracoccaceae bacterium]
MTTTDVTGAAGVLPAFRRLGPDDLAAALRAGWADFRRAPRFGLFFAAVFVGGGLAIGWLLAATGQLWWLIPAAFGFPLVAPFVALGLYEVSRRLAAGEALGWSAVLRAPFRHGNGQIPALAVILLVFFMMWFVVARVVFAVFLGTGGPPNVASDPWVVFAAEMLPLYLVGGAIGAVIALALFATQVISLPLLLDRDVDFVSAMIASVGVVRDNPGPMLRWGLVIAALTVVAMLPAFLGLLLVLPLLGHASWHLYRRALA